MKKARVRWVGLTPKQMFDTAEFLSFAVLSPRLSNRDRRRALALSRSFQAAYLKVKP